MKKILITTDFSHHSKYTLKYVLNFMKEIHVPCCVLLLNTYRVLETDVNQAITKNDELKKVSQEGLKKEQIEAQQTLSNPHITIETSSHLGSLENVICQLLRKEKFDMVAMGKNGGKHVETIAKILKDYECPLLITYHSMKNSTV